MDRLEVKATLSVTDAGEIVGTAWPFGEAQWTYGEVRRIMRSEAR